MPNVAKNNLVFFWAPYSLIMFSSNWSAFLTNLSPLCVFYSCLDGEISWRHWTQTYLQLKAIYTWFMAADPHNRLWAGVWNHCLSCFSNANVSVTLAHIFITSLSDHGKHNHCKSAHRETFVVFHNVLQQLLQIFTKLSCHFKVFKCAPWTE